MTNKYTLENDLENELINLIVDFKGYPEKRTAKKNKRIRQLLSQISEKPQVSDETPLEGPMEHQNCSLRAQDYLPVR
jgi:hypothetical protein